MYSFGCAATLMLTFIMAACFVDAPIPSGGSSITPSIKPGELFLPLRSLRLVVTTVFLCTIACGLFGTSEPSENLATTLFWIVFLLVFLYLTAIFGNIYAYINPWYGCSLAMGRINIHLSKRRLRCLRKIGQWFAPIGYLGFIWIELFLSPRPSVLATILIVYSLLTLLCAAVFGRRFWFSCADPLAVLFGLIGKLAPVEYRPGAGRSCCYVTVRQPLSGILRDPPNQMASVLFVMVFLSSTTFDAIHDTTWWTSLFWTTLLSLFLPVWRGDLRVAQDVLIRGYSVYQQAGLFVFPILYLGMYLLALWSARILSRQHVPLRALACSFIYTLVPIGLAYHFTHYCTFLVAQMWRLPWLLNDPLGLKWSLFEFNRAEILPVLPIGIIWHVQIAVLLLGHVVSVFLAHRVALRTFGARREALLSQVPLLILMVGYTIVGLGIMALPLGTAR